EADGYGEQSLNYGRKLNGYDANGRLDKTTCPGGTIDKTTFNAMGWPVKDELGTHVGLTEVASRQYDDDGNLIELTLPVDETPGHDRVTGYIYDWRNRLEQEVWTVEKDGGGTWTLYTVYAYDNRSLLLSVTGYHGV